MKKKLIRISLFIIMFIFVLTFCETISFAGEKINPENYAAQLEYDDAAYIFQKGGILLKLLRNIAAVISVVVISIIGVRYMIGSVEEKAEFKQTMWPVVIGCVLITSISAILTLLQAMF